MIFLRTHTSSMSNAFEKEVIETRQERKGEELHAGTIV